jgi:hypothetical protein
LGIMIFLYKLRLTLRSARSARLEGWDTVLALPTLRDAAYGRSSG